MVAYPLGVARPEKFDPFWVVTKHAHIQSISRQNELFHNADRPTTLTNRAVEERHSPGSTFKVITAAAALGQGMTPDSVIDSGHMSAMW